MGLTGDRPKRKASEHFIRTVKRTIADYSMIAFGDAVLTAVSGGPDSIALAHVLHSLADDYGIKLAVAHLNHKLRDEESDRDAEFVAEFSRNLCLPLYLETIDVRSLQLMSRTSLEETAREARYSFFASLVEEHRFTKIAIGHQKNDNSEQVLLNLLRGSGPSGLSGIRPIRNDHIIRPLIRLQRSDILGYIEEKELSYVTDSSNSDLSIRRNRIRHQLIPELEKNYNPGIMTVLNRLGNIMQAEDRWIDSLIQADFENCVQIEKPHIASLDLKCADDMDLAAKRRLIRKAIYTVKGDLRRITLKHVDAVLHLAETGSAEGRLNLPDKIHVTKRGAILRINRTSASRWSARVGKYDSAARAYLYTVDVPGILRVEEAGAIIKLTEIRVADVPDYSEIGRNLAFLDMDELEFPLFVRNMRAGDRFSPLGVNGTQKIKKFFTDHKIYGQRRRMCPLLVCRNKIIWIAGHRIDNSVKIVTKTRRVLKAELLLA